MNTTSETASNSSVRITFSVQGDPNKELIASVVSPPLNGQLGEIDQSLGTVMYTPYPGFSGSDSFTYKVNDGTSESNVATIDIIVTP